eukprot:CAMPEP_0183366968 /NCGR_PEP_ID=MMETSP0164_2-20130417/90834_1 /TAXON_ID=221442 /ORGANISM="Coccolithus pelagicus ssp braarudi, Strain PLY182g" /LENGTH=57 /DNA_ID=CAMNT_0025542831 /DNA_START=80 /DNA_END=253 /DNA_ORIENTATION=+
MPAQQKATAWHGANTLPTTMAQRGAGKCARARARVHTGEEAPQPPAQENQTNMSSTC